MATKFSFVRSNYDHDTHSFNAPSGLTITFQRGDGTVPTVDPSGAAVDDLDPRFDHALLVPSVTTPADALPESASLSNPNGILLASGVDEDGTTPLMCWLHMADSGAHKLYTFSGGDIPTSWPPSSPNVIKTLTARTADRLYGTGPDPYTFYDLFSNSQNYTIAGKRKAFEIKDGCIFHGAIILAGQMYLAEEDVADPPYIIRGWGLAISIDRGATWTLFYDDIHEPVETEDQRGRPRGAQYCIRLAPIYQRNQSTPSECYFSCSDYRNNVGPFSGYGRINFSKITRDIGDDPPGPWTTHPVKTFEVSQSLGHVHTAQITEFGSDEAPGLQMLASIGDQSLFNRFIWYVMQDITADYTSDDSWTITDQYHGTYTSSGVQGSFSAQPAGVCFGPEPE